MHLYKSIFSNDLLFEEVAWLSLLYKIVYILPCQSTFFTHATHVPQELASMEGNLLDQYIENTKDTIELSAILKPLYKFKGAE